MAEPQAAPPARAAITGVILAGGAGSRLGGIDKGWLVLAGEPLIVRVLARLVPQVGQVLISANRQLADYRALGWPVVTDPLPGAGPLAGIAAAAARAPGRFLQIVPVDAPLLPIDLVARLAACWAPPAVYAHDGERAQPAFALLDTVRAQGASAALAAGERGLGRWLARLGAQPVAIGPATGFLNVNTPSDRRTALAQLALGNGK